MRCFDKCTHQGGVLVIDSYAPIWDKLLLCDFIICPCLNILLDTLITTLAQVNRLFSALRICFAFCMCVAIGLFSFCRCSSLKVTFSDSIL